jgi:hypothetical protein
MNSFRSSYDRLGFVLVAIGDLPWERFGVG